MRVMWFVNIAMPGHCGSAAPTLRTSGGWMLALLEQMQKRSGFKTAVVVVDRAARPGGRHSENGVDYYTVPGARYLSDGAALEENLRRCQRVISDWKPDIIHIHGTERFYGLLTAQQVTTLPTVISLQGLMGPYSEWCHYFGNRRLVDVFKMHRLLEIPLRRGCWGDFVRYGQAARQEKEIVQGNRFFMGRTAWDRAYVKAVNPAAEYFHVGELLRGVFWETRWALNAVQRRRIFVSGAGHPRKGVETLLDAVSLLCREFTDIEVVIVGWISRRSGYGRYIHKRLRHMGDSVRVLGMLDASRVSQEMRQSHVFVSPSFVDNSPNAVCEAQLIGMPVVSTYTGGVPSLIQEGVTGMLLPAGDAPMLAARVREVFEDDELAARLGRTARDVARQRHWPETVVQQVLKAYEDVSRLAGAGTGCCVERPS